MEKNKVTYLDPKYDLTFKRVFAEHKNLCISLINSLLMFEGKKRVVDIAYQTNELIPELPILKNSIVDVRCTDKSGRQFIVEMQMNWTESFKDRVLLNASKAYVIQLDKAKKIELEFVFIELPKFKPTNRTEKKLHELWLRFLTEIDENTKEVPEELLANDDIREAIGYMQEAAFTKEEKLAYDQNKIDVLTACSMLSSARQEEKLEIAKKMKISGMLLDQISEFTNLSIDEIEKL